MRHLKKGKKFGRVRKQRKALLLGLTRNLIRKGSIQTTEIKAKTLRPIIEKMITQAKVDTLANRRLLLKRLGALEVKKIFSEIAPRYKDRTGGYTRILKVGTRKNDGAPVNIIEFVK